MVDLDDFSFGCFDRDRPVVEKMNGYPSIEEFGRPAGDHPAVGKMNGYPTIEEFTPAKLAALEIAAAADHHVLLLPTHTVERNGGEILGYFSLCAAALIFMWLDSRRIQPRDSLGLIGGVHAALKMRGIKNAFTTCDPASPFRSVMDRFSYRRLGAGEFFLREL